MTGVDPQSFTPDDFDLTPSSGKWNPFLSVSKLKHKELVPAVLPTNFSKAVPISCLF